jgi:hypothetical protein
VDLISIGEAAKLLGVAPFTMRRYETPDGKWLEIFGQRIRVHRMSPAPLGRRRYDRNEIMRALARMQRAK